MAIEDLKKRIFRKKEDFGERFEREPLERRRLKTEPFWRITQSKLEDIERDVERKKARRMLWWGIVIILAFAVLALAVFFFAERRLGFSVGKAITLEIGGPEEVAAGDTVSWQVRYKNKNSVALESVDLIFEFPQNSKPFFATGAQQPRVPRERRSLGRIEAGAEGVEQFRATVFGGIDEELSPRVIMEYRPENSSARYSKETSHAIVVTHSTLGLTIEMPKELQEGQEVTIKLHVVSSADVLFENLALVVDYPISFEHKSSLPEGERAFDVDFLWRIGDLSPSEERVIVVSGIIGQEENLNQTFRARVGIYNAETASLMTFAETSESIIVRAPFLFINAELRDDDDGVISLGEDLEIILFWRNNMNTSVHNVFLETELRGEALDLKTLFSLNGTFDGTTNVLRFSPGRIPELALVHPGQEGSVKFSIKVNKSLGVKTNQDKNFVVEFIGRIDTSEIPQGFQGVNVEGRDELTLKVATRLEFSQKGYYFDNRFQNQGPLPPKLGEETEYTIVWSLVNLSNDLENVSVRATLPSYMRWKGNVKSPGSDFTYNPATAEVVWNLGMLDAGTGFLRPAQEGAFQIGLIPTAQHVGRTPELISAAIVTARDIFTNVTLEGKSPALNTQMRDDPRVGRDQQRVHE